MSGYDLNEKDIDGVLRYLKIFDPENATPEVTIAFLEFFREKYSDLALTDTKKLEEIYKEFKNKIRVKN